LSTPPSAAEALRRELVRCAAAGQASGLLLELIALGEVWLPVREMRRDGAIGVALTEVDGRDCLLAFPDEAAVSASRSELRSAPSA